ncbi:hypothetical protein [Maridesulfovibrio frigidus]|uniref:hypothetical protein n=1 Tax=Maridesulfovibrio frigidus TaxID=340956 RepID=UPI0004E2362C|nr:hypothetical protein [Maridesulfovibrio frigidus]
MHKRSIIPLIPAILIVISLVIPSYAHAHKVSVFGYVVDSEVYTESYFRKDKRVHNGKIEVYSLKTNKQLLTGNTNDAGAFNFPIPKAITKDHSGLKIVLVASEGHRNEWILNPEDIFPQSTVSNASETTSALPPEVKKNATEAIEFDSSNINISHISAQIEELNLKVDALKRIILDQRQDGPAAKDIFAGIGYILGFFGIAAFLTSRKK